MVRSQVRHKPPKQRGEAMAVTENMLIDVQVKTENSEKSLQKLSGSMEKLNSDIVTNEKILNKLSEDYKIFSSQLKNTEKQLSNVKKSTGIADESMNKLVNDVNSLNVALNNNAASSSQATGAMNKLLGVVNLLNMSFSSLTVTVRTLIAVFKFFTDPKNLKAAADYANIIAAAAYMKGFKDTAVMMRNVANNLENMTIKAEEFKEKSTIGFEETAKKANYLNNTLDVVNSSFVQAATVAVAFHSDYIVSSVKSQMETKKLDNSLKALSASTKSSFSKLSEAITQPITGLKSLSAHARHSFAAMEGVALLSPILIMLGGKLKESENDFLRWTGTILRVVGVMSAGLMGIVGLIMGAIGGLATSIGSKLMTSVEYATEKFIKFEAVMAQFKFTVEGFTKVFGEKAIGSMDQWNATMERLYKNTVFTREQLAKSIKLLIAEGQVIGLTVEENNKILERATDVAAATGRDLYEVTQMIVNGLTNNADAVLALGIDIRNTSLAHSHYIEESGLAVEQMNSQELAMARLAALYEKTVPLIGAAANQTKTISGSNMIYQKTLDDISVSIGEVGTATQLYKASLNKFLALIRDLPKPILTAYGNLKDFLGVTLTIIGELIKLGAIIFTTATAFKVLNFVLGATIGLTVTLSSVMAVFFNVVVPIAAAILALVAAMTELWKTSAGFRDTITSVTESINIFSTSSDKATKSTISLSSIIARTINIALLPFKVVMIAIAEALNLSAIAFINFKKIFVSNETTLSNYNKKLNVLWNRLRDLSKATGNAFSALNIFSETTALAANNNENLGNNIEKNINLTNAYRERVIKMAKEINSGFDENIERQKFLGNEFEKAIAGYKQAQNELNSVFKVKSSDKDAAQKYAENERKVLQASLEIEKLRLDTIKKIIDQRKTLETEILRAQGRNIAAIKLERADQLKAIDDQINGLKLTGELRSEEIAKLEQTRKLIEKTGDIKIQEERIKSLQKAVDAEKFLSDIRRENAQLDKNAVADLQARVDGRQQELNKMREALAASNDLYGRSKKAVEESKSQIDKMFDTGLARLQQEQLIELSKQRQDMQDSVNKEILTQAENIELTYQKELQLLEVKRTQLETQGLMNDQIRKQFEDMDALLSKQKDIQLKKAPGKESEALEKTGADIAGSITGAFSTGAMGMVTGAMGMVSAVVDVVDKILDFVPQLINKIAGIFDKITQLPMVLLNSIKNLARAITQSITDALPNLMKALPEIIDTILTLLFEGIPDAIDNLIAQLPDLIQMLADRLPELVEKLVAGLVSNSPRISISLMQATIKLLPMLWKEMFKYFLKLPKIIVNGIVEGLKQLVNIFKGISIKGPDTKKMVENLQLGMKSVTKTLTGESSKMFAVMDLGTASKAQEAIDTMKDQIYEGAKKGVDYLTMWWRKLLAELQKVWDSLVWAWRKVWEWIKQVWDELVRGVKAVFEFLKMIWDEVIKLLQPIFDGLKATWDWVFARLTEIWDSVKALWEWIFSKLEGIWSWLKETWASIVDGLSSVWEKLKGVGGSIWESFKDALSNGFSFFRDLGSKIWDGLKSGLEGIGNFVKDIFDKMNPMNLFNKIFSIDPDETKKGKGGTVENTLGINVPFVQFAKGGLVPGNPMVKGDSFLNDRILALLSPGEAIIPRSLMENPAVKTIVDSVLNNKTNPLGLWKGGISIGGQNILTVSDKGIKVGETEISSAKDLIDVATNVFGNVWDEVREKVFGIIMKIFESNKFHTGGLVPSFAGGGEVPAMLNPGEFVLNRSATQGLGLNLLNNMNRGNMGSIQPNITLNIEINTTQPIDDVFFRNTLMPRIKDDIKRRTLNGEFIISSKGVR